MKEKNVKKYLPNLGMRRFSKHKGKSDNFDYVKI